jgi:hypothetical protein
MPFTIRMGIPQMEEYWQDLKYKNSKNTLSKEESKIFKKLVKAFYFLSNNPKHNGLNSHEIDELSVRQSKIVGKKIKVFQSYLENNTPAAGRFYWCYAPNKEQITIMGIEPHPEDSKRDGYNKVLLSGLPPVE